MPVRQRGCKRSPATGPGRVWTRTRARLPMHHYTETRLPRSTPSLSGTAEPKWTQNMAFERRHAMQFSK